MSGQDDDTEKSHEPTPRKLEQARKKGEIAKSTDVSVAAGYLGLLLAFAVTGASSSIDAGQTLSIMLEQAHELAPLIFDANPSVTIGGVMSMLFLPIAPWFVWPVLFVLAGLVLQRAFLFTPSKLVMKASRISPVQNAKNKFGRAGLFEFFKSFTKLAIYSVCLGFFLADRLSEMSATVLVSPAMAAATLGALLRDFLVIVVVVASIMAAIDYLWQRQDFLRKNMMSRKELTDEAKEAEGDPQLKQQRRQKAYSIATNQMLADVPDADVVIVNPTHYAVALRWSRQPGEAPTCVAKGVDEIAARIRERAQEAGVPVKSDPPTARALWATVDIGQEIPVDLYRPVATAIRFAEVMRKKARAAG